MSSRDNIKYAKRLIVKIGTSVVSRPDGYVCLGRLGHLVEQISELKWKHGKDIILVTSGAVGIGEQKLRRQTRLSQTLRQHVNEAGLVSKNSRASAAAGQSGLMAIYEMFFGQFDISCSQVLLTDQDLADAPRRKHLVDTFNYLLDLGVLPIVNENDVVSLRETPIRDSNNRIFWDNDSLAALLAIELKFDLLILLSDVKGLFPEPPRPGLRQEPLSTYVVGSTNQQNFIVGPKSRLGRGGMQAKLSAATNAINKGVKYVVIASGLESDVVTSVAKGELVGTLLTQHADASDHSAAEQAKAAKQGSYRLREISSEERAHILREIAAALVKHKDEILEENAKDLLLASENSLQESLKSRLQLTYKKLEILAEGIVQIANSEEPLGKVLRKTQLSEGLVLRQVSAPIGTLLVIFESRPEALPQISALAIKSGNGLLLKGGTEATFSNSKLHSIIVNTIERASNGKVPKEVIGLVNSRHQVNQLLSLSNYIDLIIPRGSSELVNSIKTRTRIPVLGHAEGICHVYIDNDADIHLAQKIAVDAKCDYPSACNAAETILVHEKWCSSAEGATPAVDLLITKLIKRGVRVFGGPVAVTKLNLLPAPSLKHEYGDLSVTVEIVSSLEAAIQHINKYGSSHTDAIVTTNHDHAQRFLQAVDSACVFANASTRFADGYRFGLGAEVGISTGRIHARGPVGVDGLLTTKWLLESENGDIVSDFSSGRKKFTHVDLTTKAKL